MADQMESSGDSKPWNDAGDISDLDNSQAYSTPQDRHGANKICSSHDNVNTNVILNQEPIGCVVPVFVGNNIVSTGSGVAEGSSPPLVGQAGQDQSGLSVLEDSLLDGYCTAVSDQDDLSPVRPLPASPLAKGLPKSSQAALPVPPPLPGRSLFPVQHSTPIPLPMSSPKSRPTPTFHSPSSKIGSKTADSTPMSPKSSILDANSRSAKILAASFSPKVRPQKSGQKSGLRPPRASGLPLSKSSSLSADRSGGRRPSPVSATPPLRENKGLSNTLPTSSGSTGRAEVAPPKEQDGSGGAQGVQCRSSQSPRPSGSRQPSGSRLPGRDSSASLRRSLLKKRGDLRHTVDVKRSPGGTPVRRKRPLNLEDPGDLLTFALQQKFKNVRKLYASPSASDSAGSHENSINISID